MVYFLHMNLKTSQIQKTILSPSMQQSIELLLLPLTELSVAVEQELQENPLLEEIEPTTKEELRLEEMVERGLQYLKDDQPYIPSGTRHMDQDEEDKRMTGLTRDVPLADHLLQQLRLEFTDLQDIQIGEMIIGHLNEDGYLSVTCAHIASSLGIKDVKQVGIVLAKIQHFDPLGVGARDLKECLLVQLPYRFNGRSHGIGVLVKNHLDDLGRKRFAYIARQLKVSLEEVKDMAKCIAMLEPVPARNYRAFNANIYIRPDVKIMMDPEGHYHIHIHNESIPQLRVSAGYRQLLKQENLSKEDATFIRDKVRHALLFMKSIENRYETIRNIVEYIVTHQKDFFDQGHRALRPMTMKEVAETIGRNESTVSRAIHNKYMDTPQGILSMKFFFSQAVVDMEQIEVSNRCVKEDVRILIEQEDKSHPLSDSDIQKYFEENGLKIARRTISKYRKVLKILPSHLRKE